MPARVVLKTRPTFYLDTSTLCDAVRAHIIAPRQADPAYAPLLPWLERISDQANLCLSLVHLLELSRWSDRETADAAARWLDERPTVWVRGMADVQDGEDEYWTRVALGLRPTEPFHPFAPSMLTALAEVDERTSSDALRLIRLPDMLDVFRNVDTTNARAGVTAIARTFHADRQWVAAQGWSATKMSDELAYRQRVELREKAHAARTRIVGRGEPLPDQNEAGEHVQDLLVSLVDGDERTMPSWRVAAAFASAWGDTAGRRKPGSNAFHRLQSSFEDYVHLAIGAAYCDVFTCDGDVSSCIGESRARLGFARQLSAKELGGPAVLTTQLLALWP